MFFSKETTVKLMRARQRLLQERNAMENENLVRKLERRIRAIES